MLAWPRLRQVSLLLINSPNYVLPLIFEIDGTVQFIHLTVKRYIQRNCKDLNHYETSFHRQFFHFKGEGNIRLAVGCLRYINLTLPSGPLSSEKHTKADLRQVRSDFPLLRYAVTGWLWHIEQVSKLSNNRFPQPYTEDLLRLIPDFLKNRDTVLTWVETLYLHGHGIDVCQLVSTSLHQWLRRKKGKEKEGVLKLIDQLAEDLNYIKQEFHHILLPEPQKIWNGMTDFLPETGLLNNRPSNVQKLIPDHPVEPNCETGFSVSEINSPVIVVSDVSLDNSRLGVATVWAPK